MPKTSVDREVDLSEPNSIRSYLYRLESLFPLISFTLVEQLRQKISGITQATGGDYSQVAIQELISLINQRKHAEVRAILHILVIQRGFSLEKVTSAVVGLQS